MLKKDLIMSKINYMGAPIVFEAYVSEPEKQSTSIFYDVNGNHVELALDEDKSNLFLEICKSSILEKTLEDGDIQGYFAINDVDYLTSLIPLVTFRGRCYNVAQYDKYKSFNDEQSLLMEIFTSTQKWKSLGIDIISISGVDLRNKSISTNKDL